MSRSAALARRGIKMAAAVVDRARPPGAGLVVLAYHRVGGGSTLELDLTPRQFEEQIAHLADEGKAVSLDKGLASLAADRAQPGVAVTFDDGTADFMEHALPVLVAHRVPATYYVATRFIDEQKSFPDNGRPLSWSALADAMATGLVTIGSHTHTHAVMDKVTVGGAAEELRRAVDLIGEHLGVVADHFAYRVSSVGSRWSDW
ncbi:MAG: polysaccharide deacetylase family protein [Acidimicrobiales bacterium]